MSNPEKRIKLDTFPGDPCPSEMRPNEIYLNDMNDAILELSVRFNDPSKDVITLSATELLLCTKIFITSEKGDTIEQITLFEYIVNNEQKSGEFEEAIEFLNSLEMRENLIEFHIGEEHDCINSDFGHLILHDDRHPVLRLLHIFNFQGLSMRTKDKDLKRFITDLALKDEKVENMV